MTWCTSCQQGMRWRVRRWWGEPRPDDFDAPDDGAQLVHPATYVVGRRQPALVVEDHLGDVRIVGPLPDPARGTLTTQHERLVGSMDWALERLQTIPGSLETRDPAPIPKLRGR